MPICLLLEKLFKLQVYEIYRSVLIVFRLLFKGMLIFIWKRQITVVEHHMIQYLKQLGQGEVFKDKHEEYCIGYFEAVLLGHGGQHLGQSEAETECPVWGQVSFQKFLQNVTVLDSKQSCRSYQSFVMSLSDKQS